MLAPGANIHVIAGSDLFVIAGPDRQSLPCRQHETPDQVGRDETVITGPDLFVIAGLPSTSLPAYSPRHCRPALHVIAGPDLFVIAGPDLFVIAGPDRQSRLCGSKRRPITSGVTKRRSGVTKRRSGVTKPSLPAPTGNLVSAAAKDARSRRA